MSNDNTPPENEASATDTVLTTEQTVSETDAVPVEDQVVDAGDSPIEQDATEQPAQDKEEIPEPAPVAPVLAPQHVTIDKAIINIREVESKDEVMRLAQTMVQMVAAPPQKINEFFEENKELIKKITTYLTTQQRNKSITDEEVKLALAYAINKNGSDIAVDDDYAIRALEDEESNWRTGEGKLRASRPTVGKGKSGVKLRGAAGIAHIRNALGLSSAIHVPCYNSGFFITVNAPDDWDMVELIQKINNEKSTMGSDTAGGVFANSSCFMRKHVRDLLVSKITSHSLKNEEGDRALTPTEAFEQILITDYAAILTYIMNMRYSKGYEYVHACTNYVGHCSHTSVVTLNLSEMVVTNFSSLNDEQREHMIKAREMGSVTISEIKKYQEMFEWNKHRVVRLNDYLDVTLKVPTILETIQEGERWMADVKETVEKIVGTKAPEKEVEIAINNMIDASVIRRYSQWVEKVETYQVIEQDDGELIRDTDVKPNFIDERADINDFMVSLVDNEEFAQKLMEEYVKFLSRCNSTLVGYPQFTCPSCGAYQGATVDTEKGKVVKAIVPFEAEEHFFILLLGNGI